MKTHFEAYRERLERNDLELKKLAENLKTLGCSVFTNKDGFINLIKVLKGDKHIIVGFSEVPYRWYLQICFKPSKEHGSGSTIETSFLIDEMPFSPEYIISKMAENPNVKDFKNPFYLTQI